MQGQHGHYQYTPTDLIEFFRSPFASWMSRYHHDFPGHLQPDADTPVLLSLATEGERHEQRILARFHADTHDVREIPATADRVALTRTAMQAGHAVIYHGALAADAFLGVTDFLVRIESPSTLGNYSYEVWDAKLARHAQPEFVLQLCCYADLLAAVQGRYPEQVTLLLSDGTPRAFRTDDYIYYSTVVFCVEERSSHMAGTSCCLAKIAAKTAEADCPRCNSSCAYKISFSINAWPCCRHASPMVVMGCVSDRPFLGDVARHCKCKNE